MSKSNAIFSQTPNKQVNSSPAYSRQNSAKTVKSQATTTSITESSPRKCKIHTEVKSSPSVTKSGTINIKSRVQISCPMSPRTNQERLTTKPSPRRNLKFNEDKKDVKNQQNTGSKSYSVTGVMKLKNLRGESTSSSSSNDGQCEADSTTSSDVPSNINVKSMRSCFEHKENKFPSKPPPSPSPSRYKARLAEPCPVTPRTTHVSVKGILTSKNRTDSAHKFRVPSSTSATPRSTRLRRSASVDTLTKIGASPKKEKLTRSTSQMLTPKHVKFQDEVTPECFSPVLLESKSETGSGESIAGEDTNLTVAVRVRPLLPGERSVVSLDNNSVKIKALGSEHCFTYDHCFDSTGENAASQQDVFVTLVQPLVDGAFQGYNVCLFAYGQTGSGKSYSMMGEEISTGPNRIPDTAGIIPRFSKQLFNTIETVEEYCDTKVEISYFEIYNEKIHDLLGPSQNGRSAPLRVREHPELGPYVVDLTMHNVQSFEKLQDWLTVGNSHKATAATEMNMNSSRSHSIFTVTLTQLQSEDRPSLCSKINLIDLAGSERLAHTCATGDRLKEGVSINRSLLTLGKVISSLAENKKRGFIPYRESILTWLLKESLGGNSRTAMLATINPSYQFLDETLSTLRYACQARNIVNTVRINESPHEKRIRELVEEIQRMKDDVYEVNHGDCEIKLKSLKEQMFETSENLSKATAKCKDYEMEVMNLKQELINFKEVNHHEECNMKIRELQDDFLKNNNTWKMRFDRRIQELENHLFEANEKCSNYDSQIEEMNHHLSRITKSNETYREKISRFEEKEEDLRKLLNQLQTENDNLYKEISEYRVKNSDHQKDISEMKKSMLDIKINSSHENCDSQIMMLQTALRESERFRLEYYDNIKTLERKCSENTNISNHDGCEREISTLKCTIHELKQASDHGKCDTIIERLKVALSEAEKFISELESDHNKLKEENNTLQLDKQHLQKEVISLKNTQLNMEKQSDHTECEDRINTLKKALSVAKSINVHVQCENRITELEKELQNLMSITLVDHTPCEEKINDLFKAVEKYASEINKLTNKHKAEINEYSEKVRSLQDKITRLTENLSKKESENNLNCLSQLKSLKDENSRLKKKKVDDDKKISSLDQQVISLTKELLEVKNQLRNSARDKDSSKLLCAQLQEQLTQQDRKLERTNQCSRQLFDDKDDKENWETPSKVIRRSIANHAKTGTVNDRCSLVMKADEIHQALKDAEEICTRLKIPWVFHLEPEVTTHSWFDVNLRVWDQRTMSSVRWPREVFLGWLKDMKEEIMSKSRGQKLFQGSPWVQKSKGPEPAPSETEHEKKERPLREEVELLRSQISALESLCASRDKREVLSAITALGKEVTQLSSKLGLSSPLKSVETNIKIKVNH